MMPQTSGVALLPARSAQPGRMPSLRRRLRWSHSVWCSPRASLDVKRGAHSGLEFVRKVLCTKVRGRPGTHFCARHLLYINESAKCTTSFVHARARTKLVVHFADTFLYNKCRAQKCATFVVHFADAFLYNKCRAQKEPLANICMSVDSQVCFFNTQAHGTAYNKQKQG